MPRPKTTHEFDENVEKAIINKLAVGEYETHKMQSQQDNEDFETYVALLDADRPEKEQEWRSDISIPEFASHVLTQSSLDVAQYFQTHDFVECYCEDEDEQSLLAAQANKELINRTLNRRDLYHFFKFIRSKTTNNLKGSVWAECRWRQETRDDVIGVKRTVEELETDILGFPLTDRETQMPATRIVEEKVYGKVPLIDQFEYDILDPRNVVTDNKYVYSAQDKDFVYVRRTRTLEELKRDADVEGYFNLHLLEDVTPTEQTETDRETIDKDKPRGATPNFTGQKRFDVYKRYGKYWAIVKERDEDGYPRKVKPGLDANGNIRKQAEWIELIQVFAKSGTNRTLIAFHPTPYRDHNGVPYKALIRGLCYVHPTRDNGMGDGQFARELQKGIDDTFNISNDRVSLATLPTFKGKRYVTEDNNTTFIEPEHVIELQDPEKDLIELQVSDNIQGALNQIQVLTTKMDQVMAIFPTTMGDMPGKASTTATAVVGAEGKVSGRTNYKAMTFEYTFLTELYWMITQMTYRFAFPETGEKLMGRKVVDFDPTRDYTYKPLSQSIESEQSKMAKIRMWQQVAQMVVQIQHPDTVNMLNYCFGEICKLMGDEYVNFAEAFLGTDVAIQSSRQMGSQAEGMEGTPTNQNMVPMTGQEAYAREAAGGMAPQ